MKKRSGRLRHILLCGILLGLLGTVGLCYMGYEKANTAEAKATPIAELRNTYIGAIDIQSDTTLREQLLQKLIGNEELTESIAASWSNHVFAELIVENYYLPKDDTISTTIGQKLLIYRLQKAYSEEELFYLCGILVGSIAVEQSTDALKPTEEENDSFISDFLTVLKDKGILSEEILRELQAKIEKTNPLKIKALSIFIFYARVLPFYLFRVIIKNIAFSSMNKGTMNYFGGNNEKTTLFISSHFSAASDRSDAVICCNKEHNSSLSRCSAERMVCRICL